MKYTPLVILLALVAASMSGCQTAAKSETNASASPNEVPAVNATAVLSLQPTKKVVLPGELKPWNRVSIYPKVKGFVKDVRVDRGTPVKKGQVLAILDAPETLSELSGMQSQWQAAGATLAEQTARYQASKLTYARLLKTSQTEGAVSLNELDQAKARMLADSALVAASGGQAQASRSHYQAKAQLAQYLTITAPFDGVVIERNVSPGALVGSGESNAKPLFVLEDNTTLRLTIAIPETFANQVPDTGRVAFSVNSVPEKVFSANFARSSRSLQEVNRAMLVEFDVNNQTQQLKAGMYAEVTLPLVRQSQTLFVPKQAVVNSSEKVFVIRLTNNQTEWVTVKKGNVVDTLVEVFGSLQAGDRIVRNASEEIRDGQTIQVIR